jgi:hypothetical protein
VQIDIGVNGKSTTSTDENRSSLARLKPFAVSFDTSKFDLTLFVTDMGDGLLFSLEYDTGLFLPESIRRNLVTLKRFAKMVANQNSFDKSAP